VGGRAHKPNASLLQLITHEAPKSFAASILPFVRLGPVTLEGRFIRLEPLTPAHAEELLAAAAAQEIWRWLPQRVETAEQMARWIDVALTAQAAGTEYPFAVVDLASGQAIGSTRYMDVSEAHKGVEVGWTWYRRQDWGGRVNPEAKLLLGTHAFEAWGAIRLYLKTDALNERSRAAILKLGAKYEGDLRNHRIRPDGSHRDSSYYSILDGEWPAVKRGLEERLSRVEDDAGR
jgi:N-acetyltransferase